MYTVYRKNIVGHVDEVGTYKTEKEAKRKVQEFTHQLIEAAQRVTGRMWAPNYPNVYYEETK